MCLLILVFKAGKYTAIDCSLYGVMFAKVTTNFLTSYFFWLYFRITTVNGCTRPSAVLCTAKLQWET